MSKRDRTTGVPATATSIPLVDPHAMPDNPSIGDLVRDATTQVSTLVRAEVELAKAEITRDVKKGLTGSVFFILALVVLLYSTFFMFFFLAELLDTWLWRWAAFLIVFILMLVVTAVFAFLGYRKVRKIRGPQQTIESVKETTAALTPGLAKFTGTPSPAAAPASGPTAVRAGSPAWASDSSRVAVDASRPAAAATAVAATSSAAPTPVMEESEYVVEAVEPEYVVEAVEPEYVVETVEVEYTEVPSAAWDPTAAVYADTGLPVSEYDEPLPGDPSGW